MGATPEANRFIWNSDTNSYSQKVDVPGVTDNLGLMDWAKLGLAGMSIGTDIANYGIAKDTLAFNKMNANRSYEADKLKYNNGLARTSAVNAVYGSPDVATKLV